MSETTLAEVAKLWRAARSSPDDVTLWPRLLSAYARLGKIEEGARRVRDLLALAPRGDELAEAFLEVLWRGGHGIGDPGFQVPKPYQEKASRDAGHLAVASRLGLVVFETRRGSIVVEDGNARWTILGWVDDRLVAVQETEGEALLLGVACVEHATLRLTRIELGATWTTKMLRLEPRGRWLVATLENAAIVIELDDLARLPDSLPREKVRRVDLRGAARAGIVRFSPDGKLLYLGSEGHELLDLRAGSVRSLSVEGHPRRVEWSPDGRWLAFHGSRQLEAPTDRNPWDEDDTGTPGRYELFARVADTTTDEVHSIPGLGEGPDEVDSSFGWVGPLVRVRGVFWDPVERATRQPTPLAAPERPGKAAKAACDEIEVTLAWGSAEPLGAGSHRKETLSRRPLAHEHPITDLAVSDDGQRLLSGESGRRGWIWDLESGRRLVAVSGESMIGMSRSGKAWFKPGNSYSIVPVGEGETVSVDAGREDGNRATYDLVDLSPDERRVVVHGWPRGIELLDVGSSTARAKAPEIVSSANRCLRFTRDGRHVVLLMFEGGNYPAKLFLLDAKKLKVVQTWTVPGVPYSFPDPTLIELPGEKFVVVGKGKPLLCERKREPREIVPVTDATSALAASSDGAELAVATKRGVELWRLSGKKPEPLLLIETPFRPVHALAYAGKSLLYSQACHLRVAPR